MIRIRLPQHLRTLAQVSGEVADSGGGPRDAAHGHRCPRSSPYPMLRGTIRDHVTKKRRDFLRFYACEEDLSNQPLDQPLPEAVAAGGEPYLVVGAIAGG